MAIKTLTAVTLAAMISLPLASSDAQQGAWIHGEGFRTCAEYLDALKGPYGSAKTMTGTDGTKYWSEGTQYIAWIEGYISGFNEFFASDPVRGLHQVQIDGPAIDAFVRQYCKAHPESKVVEAVGFLLKSQEGQ